MGMGRRWLSPEEQLTTPREGERLQVQDPKRNQGKLMGRVGNPPKGGSQPVEGVALQGSPGKACLRGSSRSS